jgi:hypothetical protein
LNTLYIHTIIPLLEAATFTRLSKRRPSLMISLVVECNRNEMAQGGAREGEVKGKLANGMSSQYSLNYLGTWCIQHYYR